MAGWNILFWFIRRDLSFSLFEKAALSYIIGLGVITLQMFFYSLFNIRFSLYPLLLPHILIFLVNGFIFANTLPVGNKPAKTKSGTFDILLLAGIVFQVFYAFFKALIKPEDSFDSVGNFAFKAKMFFIKGCIPYELFADKSIDIAHPDYPLFLPLSQTWVYMFLGRWNDLLVKALFPMFFISFLVIFYFALKRLLGRQLALVCTFFIATVPHFLNYATIGYADFALAMFYSLSFLYIFLWISYKRENAYICLAALLSFFAIWTKNEGSLLTLVNILVLSLFVLLSRKEIKKNEIRTLFILLLAIVVPASAWFAALHSMNLSNEFVNKDTFRISIALKNLDRLLLVLYDCQKHIFGPKKWNISLLVFLTGFVLYFKKALTGDFKYITLSILLAFFGYAAFYLITPLEIRYHLQTAGSRLLLHFLPLVVFWIGYLAKTCDKDCT